jgi:hypothetical protein
LKRRDVQSGVRNQHVHAVGLPLDRRGGGDHRGVVGQIAGDSYDVVDPATTIVAGRIGSAAEVVTCLSAATRRHPQRSITHWNVAEREWGEGAAALVIDDLLRRPTAYAENLLL